MMRLWLAVQDQYHRTSDYADSPTTYSNPLWKQILGAVAILAIIGVVVWKSRQDRE